MLQSPSRRAYFMDYSLSKSRLPFIGMNEIRLYSMTQWGQKYFKNPYSFFFANDFIKYFLKQEI